MKRKDKNTTLLSYVTSISIHTLLFLILMLIPAGEFAIPKAKAKNYYPVDLIIKEEKVAQEIADIVEIKVKSEIQETKKQLDTKKEIQIKDIKKSEIIEKTKKDETKKEKDIGKIEAKKIIDEKQGETTPPAEDGEKGKEAEKEGKTPEIIGVITLPMPRYSKTAQNLEVEGKVELTFRSNEKGEFEKLDALTAEITNTAGDEERAKEEIKQIAISTVKRGQYGPMQGITIVCLFEKIGDRFEARCYEKK